MNKQRKLFYRVKQGNEVGSQNQPLIPREREAWPWFLALQSHSLGGMVLGFVSLSLGACDFFLLDPYGKPFS